MQAHRISIISYNYISINNCFKVKNKMENQELYHLVLCSSADFLTFFPGASPEEMEALFGFCLMVSCVCSASVFVNCMGAGWVFLGELLFGF
jgi:uncharacterized membrane protein